jgi:hypothetical protein
MPPSTEVPIVSHRLNLKKAATPRIGHNGGPAMRDLPPHKIAPPMVSDLPPRKTAGVREFQKISDLSHASVYRLINSGDLKSIRIGRKRLILLDSWHQLIERRAAEERG